MKPGINAMTPENSTYLLSFNSSKMASKETDMTEQH
jgi:hypothetical protein